MSVVASLFLFTLGCIAAWAVRARRRQLFEVAQRVGLRFVAFDDGVSAAMVSMQCFCFLSFAACFIGVVSKTGATIAALYTHASEWWEFVKKWYKGSVGRCSSNSVSTIRYCGCTPMAKWKSIQKNKRLVFLMAAIICAVTGPMVVRADGKGHYRRYTGTCEAWVSESDCPGIADGWSGASWGRTDSWSGYPPRCYYYSSGDIWYNTNTGNDCSASSLASCICQCPAGRYSDTAAPPEGSCPACPAGTVRTVRVLEFHTIPHRTALYRRRTIQVLHVPHCTRIYRTVTVLRTRAVQVLYSKQYRTDCC